MTESSNESRLESRLAQVEAQVEALKERVGELTVLTSRMKQAALWTRVLLLLTVLGAFFFVRSLGR
jgi:hypothetical protein